MKGPTITECIEMSGKFRKEDDFDFTSIINDATKVSNTHTEEAAASQKQKVKGMGSNAFASVVVIQNHTATRLAYEIHADESGEMHGDSGIPKHILPGSNGAFVHCGKATSEKRESASKVIYGIDLYTGSKWISSGSAITLSFQTGPSGRINETLFAVGRKSVKYDLAGTRTNYDGQSVVCNATVDDKFSKVAVHTITISQEKGGFKKEEFSVAKAFDCVFGAFSTS